MYGLNEQRIINQGGTVFFVQQLTLSEEQVSLRTGDRLNLKATCSPEEAADRLIAWESSDSNVVTVNQNGQILANAIGQAMIRVSCDYGEATCKVTVEKGKPSIKAPKAIDLMASQVSFQVPFDIQKGAGALKFTSENTDVITVDSKGKGRIHHAGMSSIQIRVGENQNFFSTQKKIAVTAYNRELPVVEVTGLISHEKGILLKWKSIPEVEGYFLYRKQRDGFYEKIAVIRKNDICQVLDNTVQTGQYYMYCVRGFNGQAISPEYSSGKGILYLAVPENQIILNEDDGILLKWKLLNEVDGYNVFRSSGGGSLLHIATLDKQTYQYKDSQLIQGTSYNYFIRAKKGDDLSPEGKQRLQTYYLREPKITAVNNADGYVRIAWKKVLYAESYQVLRRTLDDKEWVKIAETENEFYDDKQVAILTGYIYRVNAVKDEIICEFHKNERGVFYIDMPKLYDVLDSREGLLVSWRPVIGAESYLVFRMNKNRHWGQIGVVKGETAAQYLDQSVVSGEEYTYTVRAVYRNSMSQFDGKGIRGVKS